jgi:hypothetical protein
VVTLRFYGDDLDPDHVTRLLGAEPTKAVRKDDIWKTPGGREKVARTGSWRLEAEDCSPGDLDGQIARLLGQLTDTLPVWLDLTSRFRADLFCGMFMEESNEGLSHKPATLR